MKHLKPLLAIIGLLVFAQVPAATKDFVLHQAVLDEDITLVKKLLSKGAAIDVIGSRKYGYGSALHLAVREGHLDIAKLLLKRGAQVDVLDPDDLTPLHNAAWNGNLDMAKLLLDAGADIEASTYDGDTPLKLAQNNNQPKVAEFIQAKIQAPSATRTKVESPVIADSRVIDISGTYIAETTAGTMSGGPCDKKKFVKKLNGKLIVLKQTGNTITGSVSSQSNWIKGTREGNIINFYIIMGNEIIGSWEINADATHLEGKWFSAGCGSGKWNLTKIETTPPPSLTGTYTAKISYDNLGAQDPRWLFGKKPTLQISLKQNDDAITGFISGDRSGEIEGLVDGKKIVFDYYINVPGTESREGQGTWYVGDDPATLSGDFKITTDVGNDFFGKWNLTKIETTPPPSLTGTYTAEITGSKALLVEFLLKSPNSGAKREFKLVQKGNQITGTFDDGLGKIYGDIEGDTIKFEWTAHHATHGRGKWTIKPDTNEVVGTFESQAAACSTCGFGKLRLTRIE